MTLSADLAVAIRRGRTGACAIFEGIGLRELHRFHRMHRLLEILLRLARKAHDDICGKREVGARGAELFHDPVIVGHRVPAVHRLEHVVGPGLERQMQIRHELRQIAMGRDQGAGHLVRVARRKPQALDAADVRQAR